MPKAPWGFVFLLYIWQQACAMIHAGETFGTEDPRTGEIYTQVAEAQEADVDAAVKAARMVCFSFHTHSPLPVLCPAFLSHV